MIDLKSLQAKYKANAKSNNKNDAKAQAKAQAKDYVVFSEINDGTELKRVIWIYDANAKDHTKKSSVVMAKYKLHAETHDQTTVNEYLQYRNGKLWQDVVVQDNTSNK